jgi:PKD repeat protein
VKLIVSNAAGEANKTQTDYIAVSPLWDLNNDHACSIGDITVLGSKWSQTGSPGWIAEDVNKDGVINISDVVTIGLHWNETW